MIIKRVNMGFPYVTLFLPKAPIPLFKIFFLILHIIITKLAYNEAIKSKGGYEK